MCVEGAGNHEREWSDGEAEEPPRTSFLSIQFHLLSAFLVPGIGLGADRELGSLGPCPPEVQSLSGLGASSGVSLCWAKTADFLEPPSANPGS